MNLLFLAWWILAATLTGRRLLFRSGSPAFSAEEPLLFFVHSFATGSGVLSIICLLLGLFGLFRPTFLIIGCLVFPVLSQFFTGRITIEKRNRKRPASGDRFLLWGSLIFGFVFLAQWLRFALLPESAYDALVYHLPLPRAYLEAGKLLPAPEMIFSGLPQAMEMIFGLGLAFSGELAAKMTHAVFGIFLSVAIYSLVVRWTQRRAAGVVAAFLFVSAPIVGFEFGTANVELAQALFLWLALDGLDRLRADKPGAAALTGWYLGLACAVKISAGLTLVVFLPLILLFAKGSWPARFRHAATAAFFSLIAIGPWLLRNWADFGNPVFPFLPRWFSATKHLAAQMDVYHREILRLPYGVGHGWTDFFHLLRDLTFSPESFGGAWIGPAFLFLLPFGLVMALWKSRWRPVALLWLCSIAIWFLTCQHVRFLVPLLPLMAALGALALDGLTRLAGPGWRRSFAFLPIALVVMIGVLSLSQSDLFSARLADETPSQYRARVLGDPWKAFSIVADRSGEKDRMLVIGRAYQWAAPNHELLSPMLSPTAFQIHVVWQSGRLQQAWGQMHAARIRWLVVDDEVAQLIYEQTFWIGKLTLKWHGESVWVYRIERPAEGPEKQQLSSAGT